MSMKLQAEAFDGVERGDVDLDVGLGVQNDPLHHPVTFVDRGQGTATEVSGVGEEE
ncbi:hypothetical protein ACFYNY_24630 [Streptomyces sp. NPDC006530]|uniref:hypothetical protein n=1 Tax=Streptomyces sp. NPDC006530 TaxID=3364750 RepID=UPI0036793342